LSAAFSDIDGDDRRLTLLARFRAAMPIVERVAYFDHAAVAPLPAPTRDSLRSWLNQAADEGDLAWGQWSRRIETVRQTAAQLIHAEPAEIALVPNTTSGIGLVAEGLPWQSGDNVITLDNEFPSNQYPWMNLATRGVELRRVPAPRGVVDLNRLESACDQRTRIVTLSWVGYATGWRIDPTQVAELCRRRGCLFFLDAIQGLGVFPLDVRTSGIDFLAADGHKWLLGPEGAGILFIRHEHLAQLRPMMVGWNSVVQGNDYSRVELNLRDTAARYEGGSQNMIGFHGLGASLDLLTSLGAGPHASPIAEQVLALTDFAAGELAALGATLLAPRSGEHRSGIVTFSFAGRDPQVIRRRLETAGIVVRCRGGGVRLSPHGYNTREEIERMIAELRRILTNEPNADA